MLNIMYFDILVFLFLKLVKCIMVKFMVYICVYTSIHSDTRMLQNKVTEL